MNASMSTPHAAPDDGWHPSAGQPAADPGAAKLWLRLFLIGFAFITGLLAITVTTTVPYGDLSRIGLISDHEFGWQVPQPEVAPEYLQGTPIPEADILVIGDSFSMTHRWQSQLTKAGYRVATTFWGQIGEALCKDFDGWLAQAGFRGQLVMIQSVERLLGARMEATDECTQMKAPLSAQAAPFVQPMGPAGFARNWGARLTTGWITYRNTREAKQNPADTKSGMQTLARAVPNGCEMFSHRLCNKALFFSDDDDNGEITLAHLASMQAFTRAHTSIPILWMVIPNKTTIYLEPEHSEAFFNAWKQAGLGPDLYTFSREQRLAVRDFYFPNDTHLSMHGQLVLGERMLEEVRKIVPTPPAKSS